MIQINLLNTSANQYRWPIIKVSLNELFNIKDINKKKIKLVIFFNKTNKNSWIEYISSVSPDLNIYLCEMDTDDYMNKVNVILSSDCEYICKWDDDVFLNRHIWDYMLENLNILDDESISVLTPILSNGMPSVELFIKDFLNPSEKKYVSNIFKNRNVNKTMWGCNYQLVYDYINSIDEWNGDSYWKFMDEFNPTEGTSGLPWFYSIAKGVHPSRFSYEYNMFVAEYSINNRDNLLSKRDFYLEKYLTPYLCNNIFITKTEFYIDSQKLFRDGWDEGQLTMLARNKNLSPVYVRNGYGIHMAYGCTDNQRDIENFYMENLFKKII